MIHRKTIKPGSNGSSVVTTNVVVSLSAMLYDKLTAGEKLSIGSHTASPDSTAIKFTVSPTTGCPLVVS